MGTPDVSDLPEPLRTDLWDKVKDFAGQPMSNWLQTQIRKTMKAADDRTRFGYAATRVIRKPCW